MANFAARTMSSTDMSSHRPLYVNNCGYICDLADDMVTSRPGGRRDYQLIIVEKGILRCLDRELTLKEGSLLLYRPGQVQHYVYTAQGGLGRYCFLHFSGKAAGEYAEALPDFAEGLSTAAVIGYHKQIMGELRTHSIGFDTRCAGLMLCLFGEIQRRMAAASRVPADLSVIADWIDVNYARSLHDPEFLRLMGEHPRARSAAFAAGVGMTPLRYQQKVRLNKAAGLLLESGISIRDASEAVGYQDPLYFSRLFSGAYGMSPTEYRKKQEVHSCTSES